MNDEPISLSPRARRWSPYVVGAGIGVLSWITFLSMDRALGTSSALVHAAGALVGLASPSTVVGPEANAYFAKEISEKTPMLDWQMMLVFGVAIGAWTSSRLSNDPVTECVPPLWSWRFGPSKAVRYAAAFSAGLIMAFGARMAGGCTSGHGISGGLQLAVSSWTFFFATFAAGVATAFALFGKEGRRHVHG
jgi:uncharacterized membrane protein YedE/YeeE